MSSPLIHHGQRPFSGGRAGPQAAPAGPGLFLLLQVGLHGRERVDGVDQHQPLAHQMQGDILVIGEQGGQIAAVLVFRGGIQENPHGAVGHLALEGFDGGLAEGGDHVLLNLGVEGFDADQPHGDRFLPVASDLYGVAVDDRDEPYQIAAFDFAAAGLYALAALLGVQAEKQGGRE